MLVASQIVVRRLTPQPLHWDYVSVPRFDTNYVCKTVIFSTGLLFSNPDFDVPSIGVCFISVESKTMGSVFFVAMVTIHAGIVPLHKKK